jgi:hypothetical protein
MPIGLGYLKAVWPFFFGAFLRSGRLRGPGKAFQTVGGEAPRIFEGLPGPPGLARPQKCTQKDPARLPSGTQHTGSCACRPAPTKTSTKRRALASVYLRSPRSPCRAARAIQQGRLSSGDAGPLSWIVRFFVRPGQFIRFKTVNKCFF